MPILKVKDGSGCWLNVFGGSNKTVAIDDTLTQSGQAADAKAVGERFNLAYTFESTECPGCYYRMVNGNQEWINPPMMFGTVYRTTERFNGKVVYACAVEIPELSEAPLQSIDLHSIINGAPEIINLYGTITYNGMDYEHIPLHNGDESYIIPYIDFGDAGLVIEQSGYEGCFGRLEFKFIYND